MRVGNNITVFAGDTQSIQDHDNGTRGKQSEGSKTLYAGNLTSSLPLRDRIQMKKEQARQRALKVVGDVWDGDRKIDQDLEDRREHIRELRGTIKEAQDGLNEIKAQKEELAAQYGITDEKKELMSRGYSEMQKRFAAEMNGEEYDGGENALTDAEWAEFHAIENNGYDEYRQRSMELGKVSEYYSKMLAEAAKEVRVEQGVIRGIRQERLKKDPMLQAQQEAEDILEGSRDEIIGMAVEEAKEHLDEEQEKREEEAEAIEEERKEQEELLEERKKEEEELEELMKDMPLDDMTDMSRMQGEIQQEVQQILNKMNLVAEDIKGAKVDANI